MTTKPSRNRKLPALYPAPKQPKFYAALGRFVFNFARMEAQAYQTLLYYSGHEALVRAINGGMRLSNVLGGLSRLAKLSGYVRHRKDDLGAILAQINAITEFRDRLVHRVPGITKEQISSNNLSTYRVLEDLEEITFTIQDINNAAIDLEYVCARLSYFSDIPIDYRYSMIAYRHYYETHLVKPWLYKPLKPHTPLKGGRPTPR